MVLHYYCSNLLSLNQESATTRLFEDSSSKLNKITSRKEVLV